MYSLLLFESSAFWIAILSYVPAIIFLSGVMFLQWSKTKNKTWLYGLGGLLLAILASILQTLKVSIHPIYCTHNALYHIILWIAMGGLFFFCWKMGQEPKKEDSKDTL